MLFVAVVAPFGVVAFPQAVGADHSFVVLSTSMRTTIPEGSVVIVENVSASEVSEGDVITFLDPEALHGREAQSNLTTHRVIDVFERDGTRYFRTKGDANDDPDPNPIPASNLVGRVVFHIPYLGYVLVLTSQRNWILLFVVVPVSLLILTELWTILKHL